VNRISDNLIENSVVETILVSDFADARELGSEW
jgi:hypothetical protein